MCTSGEMLFLNFVGDIMGYVDRVTGELIPYQVFVVIVLASDYGCILFVRSQCLENFVDVSFNRVMEDMANHYGTVVVPLS